MKGGTVPEWAKLQVALDERDTARARLGEAVGLLDGAAYELECVAKWAGLNMVPCSAVTVQAAKLRAFLKYVGVNRP